MIDGRELLREEIERIWTIDRREMIEAVYTLESSALALQPAYYDMQGWPPGEAEASTRLLEDCYDHGGWFYGLFDDGRLVGVAVLESRFIGRPCDQLQLVFLHVSHGHRDQGLGRRLFELAATEARRRGARRLYISATPSEHTIGFYLGLGCAVTAEPDPELLALEPEDIHLEYDLDTRRRARRGD
ncbi:MAG TPA: GNAT family N-acetyltransferase [Anaerolineae bacterium]|nr:GNAT family N-acetyltransferase [Anaerolineae bacterium]